MKIPDSLLMQHFEVGEEDIEYSFNDRTTRMHIKDINLPGRLFGAKIVVTFEDKNADIDLITKVGGHGDSAVPVWTLLARVNNLTGEKPALAMVLEVKKAFGLLSDLFKDVTVPSLDAPGVSNEKL